MKRAIEVEVENLHVRLRCGGILMHSEEYASESNARRAANSLIEGINTRPMFLSYWLGKMGYKKRVRKQVRKVWQSGSGKTVVLPVDGGPDQARPPYFDPALENLG